MGRAPGARWRRMRRHDAPRVPSTNSPVPRTIVDVERPADPCPPGRMHGDGEPTRPFIQAQLAGVRRVHRVTKPGAAAQRADRPHRRPAFGHARGDAEDARGIRRGWRAVPQGGGDHAAVLPVAVDDHDRPLPAQHRRARQRRRAPARPGHDGAALPARRRVPDRHGREVPQRVAGRHPPAELRPVRPGRPRLPRSDLERRRLAAGGARVHDPLYRRAGRVPTAGVRRGSVEAVVSLRGDPGAARPVGARPGVRRHAGSAVRPRPGDAGDRPVRQAGMGAGPGGPVRAPVGGDDRHNRAQQLRTLRSVDDVVGQVFAELDRLGQANDTLAFFLSDNGFLWGEHGLAGDLPYGDNGPQDATGKRFPYLPSVHVPFAVRWPGHVLAGARPDGYPATVDLAPTILQAAGVPAPTDPPMDGRPLLAPGNGGLAPGENSVYLEYFQDPLYPTVPAWSSILSDDAQYVRWFDSDGATTEREFYDLADDPYELVNLFGDASAANDPDTA